MQSKLSKHREQIAKYLEDGFSSRHIAHVFGVGKSTVNDFIKAEGLDRPEPQKNVAIIDIETRPALAYVWGVWQQNIAPQQIVEDKAMISFAARWVGETKTYFYSDHHTGHEDMVAAAWEWLDTADVVVHYNGAKFDIPHINQEFLLAGYTPPSSYYQLDLLKSIRRDFNFTSNKLDNIAKQLKLGSKVEHEGFALWTKCLAGDKKAWAKMKEYNIHDTEMTQELYEYLLPWVSTITHPRKYALSHKKVGALI